MGLGVTHSQVLFRIRDGGKDGNDSLEHSGLLTPVQEVEARLPHWGFSWSPGRPSPWVSKTYSPDVSSRQPYYVF